MKNKEISSVELKAWTEVRIPLAKHAGASLIQVRRNGKGCLSYVLGSKGEAVVVDPSVSSEAYVQIADREGPADCISRATTSSWSLSSSSRFRLSHHASRVNARRMDPTMTPPSTKMRSHGMSFDRKLSSLALSNVP